MKNHLRLKYPVAYTLLVLAMLTSMAVVAGAGGWVVAETPRYGWLLLIGVPVAWGLLHLTQQWSRGLGLHPHPERVTQQARSLGWAVAHPHLVSRFDAWVVAQGFTQQEKNQQRAQRLDRRLAAPVDKTANKRPRF